MHDAFLKSAFADRRMIEMLIAVHAPEWTSRTDLASLRRERTELVSRRTLQARHPDMIWSADTLAGGRVVFLIEFQRTVDRLMALRTTTYASLTLEGIAAADDFPAGEPLPEIVCLVLYHGDGPWTAPARLADLFRHSDPARHRLVPFRAAGSGDRADGDLPALVLGLARNLSPGEMAGQLSALAAALGRLGDADLERFLAGRVTTMLTLREYPEALRLEGATTMAETVDRFRQGLDELFQRGLRRGKELGLRRGEELGLRRGEERGLRAGKREGQALLLRQMASRRFGEETARRLSALLDDRPGEDAIQEASAAVVECATREDLIERLSRI